MKKEKKVQFLPSSGKQFFWEGRIELLTKSKSESRKTAQRIGRKKKMRDTKREKTFLMMMKKELPRC